MKDHTAGHLRHARNLLLNAGLALKAAANGIDHPYGARNELALLAQMAEEMRVEVVRIEHRFAPTQPAGTA